MAFFGPAIRGYKAYKSNKQLKEKLAELKKLSRSKKKLFNQGEWKKIQSNMELTTLYINGVINGDQVARQNYYSKVINNMAKEIEQKKKSLETANAKKIDVARLGLTLQKLAQEFDKLESEQDKKLKNFLNEADKKIDIRLDEAENKVAEDIENLTEGHERLDKEFTSTKASLNKDVKKLKNHVEGVVSELNGQIKKTDSEIRKIKIDLNDLERRHNKLRFKVDEHGKDIHTNQQNISMLSLKLSTTIKVGIASISIFIVGLVAVYFLTY